MYKWVPGGSGGLGGSGWLFCNEELCTDGPQVGLGAWEALGGCFVMGNCVLMGATALMGFCALMGCSVLMGCCVLMGCFLLRGVARRSVNSAVILVAPPRA